MCTCGHCPWATAQPKLQLTPLTHTIINTTIPVCMLPLEACAPVAHVGPSCRTYRQASGYPEDPAAAADILHANIPFEGLRTGGFMHLAHPQHSTQPTPRPTAHSNHMAMWLQQCCSSHFLQHHTSRQYCLSAARAWRSGKTPPVASQACMLISLMTDMLA
jgi:hypothetical protein